jgi:DNA-binding transcriptional LysR family regulator
MLDPELELTHLLDDAYDAILPLGHKLAERRQLRLADLSDEPWIASTVACGCRQITERACNDAGFEPRVAFEADETLAAQALVAAGVGVTLLPRLALASVHPKVVARRLAKPPVRRIWAARPPASFQSPASEAMLQILRDVADDFRSAELELAS